MACSTASSRASTTTNTWPTRGCTPSSSGSASPSRPGCASSASPAKWTSRCEGRMEHRALHAPRHRVCRGDAGPRGGSAESEREADDGRRHAPRRHADGIRRQRRRGGHRGEPRRRPAHRDARVEDQLHRRLPLGHGAGRSEADPQGQAHARLGDAHHRRGRQAPLGHHADANDPLMDVQGHRGARGYLPENTLPAFAKALDMGVTTLELDVGVTRDGVVVVHHDRGLNPDIARGPDGQWVPRATPINAMTYEELQRYDVGRLRPGSDYAKRFPQQRPLDGTRIPKLSELFALAGNANVRFNIEPKSDLDRPDETLAPEPFARALIAEVRKGGMEKRTTVQAFDWRLLKVVEREAPEMPTVYCTEGRGSEPARVHDAGGKIWSPDFERVTPEKLAAARQWH